MNYMAAMAAPQPTSVSRDTPPPPGAGAGLGDARFSSGGPGDILVIDNYDSFTWNLVHYLAELGAGVRIVRNDALTAAEALALRPGAVVLSPGPCAPDQAGVCLDLLRQAPADLPILGVCLGHQAIGQAFGGEVVRARAVLHGKTSPILHDGSGVFAGVRDSFTATRYHSLAVSRADLPDSLRVTAWTADGEIMGLSHRARPVHGVQFHPESIATEAGHDLLSNFLTLAGVRRRAAA
jgi:anthranilate synthase component 2